MVVKEKRGRRRYIAFSVSDGLGKQDLIRLLRRCCPEPPYVVQCGGGLAVVRCAPSETESLKDIMLCADPSSASIMTSGTLKALRSKIPGLAAPAGCKG